MKILILGKKIRREELEQRLSSVSCERVSADWDDVAAGQLADADIIFDLDFDTGHEHLKQFSALEDKPVFVSAVKIQLARAVKEMGAKMDCMLFGLNAIPGFINRSLAEVSVYNSEDTGALKEIMDKLGWQYRLVSDRVGMITPRIIFMIINEACYTLQEGTAGISDIDTSMKLGTNYPHGPFEWADKIGISEVYETLEALYEDTKDERYRICPLLKTKYLRAEPFYN